MWFNDCWVRSHKQCHSQSVRMTIGVLALVIAAVFVNVSVYLLHSSVVPSVERVKQRQITMNSIDIQNMTQNVSTYLNERALDYSKGKRGSWGYHIPEGELLFCPIAKVACAEWKRTMRWIGGLQNWETIEHQVHKQGNIPITIFEDEQMGEHKDTRERVHALQPGHTYNDLDPGILEMMPVRNPISRLVSGFKQKCILAKEYGICPYLNAFPSIWNGTPPSKRTRKTDAQYDDALRDNGCYDLDVEGACNDIFAEFVTYLDLQMNQKGRCRVDVHFRPHSCFCDVWRNREQFTLLPYNRMAEVAVESLVKSRAFTPDERYKIGQFISYRMGTPHDDPQKLTNSSHDVGHFYNDNEELREKVVQLYAYNFELMKDILEWA